MQASIYVQDLIQTKQGYQDQQFFEERAHLSFKESGASWLDLHLLHLPSRHSHADSHLPSMLEKVNFSTNESSHKDHRALYQISDSKELWEILQASADCFKFFFVRQKNSRSRLDVSQELFDSLCEFSSIFHKFRDYALCFGIKGGDIHVNPPAMRYFFRHEPQIPSMRGATIEFEIAYVIRSVESNNRTDGIPWSIRQAAVYQKYSGANRPHTWLFLALPQTLEAQLELYLSNIEGPEVPNASEIHFVLFDAAISSWRGCVLFFAEVIQKQSDLVFMAQFEVDEFTVVQLDGRQYIKKIEDNIVDIVTALSFMMTNLDTIIEFQKALLQRYTLSLQQDDEHQENDNVLLSGFEQRKIDLGVLLDQAHALHLKVKSISNLVSNLLDLNNGNALKLLAIETRRENVNMSILTKKSVQDAATIKVLTIVTLIYLPLTVVTNLFSTSFIGTTTGDNGKSKITVTNDIWILFAVGIPLTIVTIYVWWIFAQKEIAGRFPGGWEAVAQRGRAVFNRSPKAKPSHEHIDSAALH